MLKNSNKKKWWHLKKENANVNQMYTAFTLKTERRCRTF